jgi:hypothetical protein
MSSLSSLSFSGSASLAACRQPSDSLISLRLDVNESVWIGGTHDHSGAGHERGPYWLNGVVPLSAQLNASGDATSGALVSDLNPQVTKWIYYILDHQTAEGWLGPDDGFGGKGNDSRGRVCN